jgi:hypothetical protein
MIRDLELKDLYDDFRCLLQITNKDPQEDVRLKKLCTAIMTLACAIDRLQERQSITVQDVRQEIRSINADLDSLSRRTSR